jgi:hypothetical protein
MEGVPQFDKNSQQKKSAKSSILEKLNKLATIATVGVGLSAGATLETVIAHPPSDGDRTSYSNQ